MTEEEFSKGEAAALLGGSISSPLYTIGVEELGHSIGLKLLGGNPELSFVGKKISDLGFEVSEAGGHSLDQAGESIVAAAGPFSVLGISALTAYHSQQVENEKSKKFWEGISITSALSPALYVMGDYMDFTQGDFEIMSQSLPYEASVPLVLGSTATVIGYSRKNEIKDLVDKTKDYLSDLLPDSDSPREVEYPDDYQVAQSSNFGMDDEEYEEMVETIEELKDCELDSEEWNNYMEKLEEYDINTRFIEDAAKTYREISD